MVILRLNVGKVEVKTLFDAELVFAIVAAVEDCIEVQEIGSAGGIRSCEERERLAENGPCVGGVGDEERVVARSLNGVLCARQDASFNQSNITI